MPAEAPSKERTAKRGLPPDLKRLGQVQALFDQMPQGEIDRALIWLTDKYGKPKKDRLAYDPQ